MEKIKKPDFLIEDMAWVLKNFMPHLIENPTDFSMMTKCANAMWIMTQIGYGDIFLIDDFIENVEEGYFIDYDGSGCWVDDAGNRLGHIICDTKWLRENQPADAKFVAWFNK